MHHLRRLLPHSDDDNRDPHKDVVPGVVPEKSVPLRFRQGLQYGVRQVPFQGSKVYVVLCRRCPLHLTSSPAYASFVPSGPKGLSA
jgi:hypothetical protein